jgi:drug/metabolite transporter (DMT)-like permease
MGVVILGLIGVLVILRPGIASFNPATVLVLTAAFGYAVTMITTKQLTATETTFGIIFWMAVIQFPLSLLGSNPSAFLHLKPHHIFPTVGVGIGGLTSHFCLSNAFRCGDATLVVPLDFMRIPFDRGGCLVFLRRATGFVCSARCNYHCVGSALEPAFGSRTCSLTRRLAQQ